MTDKMVEAYLKALESEERAAATIEKYRRALLSFAAFLSGAAVTREMIRLWKDDLRASNYALFGSGGNSHPAPEKLNQY